jgi:rSAM/selenodomain-associated transferase 2
VRRCSIIVPVLNEAALVGDALARLQPFRERGHEVIVVDGGSRDATAANAAGLADRVLVAPPGRARQMNAGAAAASGAVLIFLHVDTRLPPDADRLIDMALDGPAYVWGRFDVRLSGRAPLLRVIETLMNWRSRLTGIATGDQAIFVETSEFRAIGGYADLPLMEDIDFSRRLNCGSRPACLRDTVVASSRRWEARGILRTVLLMWTLRLAFYLGVSPARLHRWYYRGA